MLNGKALTPQMIGQLASMGIRGSKIGDFAASLSEGIVEGFLATNSVTTMDVGIAPAGIGIGTGKFSGLNPNALMALMPPNFASKRILGIKSKDLAKGVSMSLCLYFNQANMVNSTHPTVGVGTGIGKVINVVPAVMTAKVMAKMSAKGIAGSMMMGMVTAICDSFSKHVMTSAVVNVVIVGPPLLILGVPVPGAGPGIGKTS